MSIEPWPISTILLASPAVAIFGLWWWRDRRQTRLVREAVARRKHHAERWS